MPSFDPRIDAYIENAAPFAQPILEHLRDLVHKNCPMVEETWKWSFPHFIYKDSIICQMAAFKQHCTFGFWLGAVMNDPDKILSPVGEKSAMGHLGRISSLKDLPSDKILSKYIKQAMELADKGTKLPKKPPVTATEIEVPAYLTKELKKNKEAWTNFQKFPPSHKKEYILWITEAKTEETRNKRMATAIEWISEGKGRNWKYEKVK